MQGAQPRHTAFSDYQRLSPTQENHLAKWVRIQAALGLPPTHQQLKDFAERILQVYEDVTVSYPTVGSANRSWGLRRNNSTLGRGLGRRL